MVITFCVPSEQLFAKSKDVKILSWVFLYMLFDCSFYIYIYSPSQNTYCVSCEVKFHFLNVRIQLFHFENTVLFPLNYFDTFLKKSRDCICGALFLDSILFH